MNFDVSQHPQFDTVSAEELAVYAYEHDPLLKGVDREKFVHHLSDNIKFLDSICLDKGITRTQFQKMSEVQRFEEITDKMAATKH